jgi:hypothetical protein
MHAFQVAACRGFPKNQLEPVGCLLHELCRLVSAVVGLFDILKGLFDVFRVHGLVLSFK